MIDDVFDVLPDDIDTTLKHYLIRSITLHVEYNRDTLSKQEIIECSIIKKLFQHSSLAEIFEAVDFTVDDDEQNIIMNFSNDMKLYVDNEYNKYIKNIL